MNQIKKRRILLEITQADFATGANISIGSLQQAEKGVIKTITVRDKIFKHLEALEKYKHY